MKRCAKCVLPESPPDIYLDAAGICNVCRLHEQQVAEESGQFLETDFVRMIDKYRGKGKYDCLVMCSGGKDSTASLYYMKHRYRMNCLAFTFDQGFETEDAMENVRNATEALGVDFLFFKTNFMKKMFGKMISSGTKAVICHPCSIWYMQLTFDMAARFDIPLIIAGWTKGQAAKEGIMSKCACTVDAPEYVSMAKATKDFLATLKDDTDYRDFPTSMEEVQKRAQKKHKAIVLSPHWFLDQLAEDYVEVIKRECNWKQPRQSYPANSTNCAMNNISAYNSLKNYGYTHYHVEMSKLVRQGLMTREEALKHLEVNFSEELLKEIAAGCGVDLNVDLKSLCGGDVS